jgi:hypothetical protein
VSVRAYFEVMGFVVGFVVLAVVLHAVSHRGPAPKEPRGRLVLRYSRRQRIVGWIGAFVGTGIGTFVALLVYDYPDHPLEWLLVTLVGFFGSIYGVVEVNRAHAVIDDQRIVMRRAWKGPIDVAWDDVDHVRYNDMLYWLTFWTKDGRRFRVSRGIGNFGELLKTVRKKIAGRRFVDSGTSNLIATDLTKP